MLKQFPPQTSFGLNGPHLSFIQNPVGITTENGYPVTLVGIATASFKTGVSTDSPNAPANPAVSTGSLSYQWYEVGINGAADKKVVDDVTTNNGVITGSGTTCLTIQKVVAPQDDGKQYYLSAEYIPSTTTGEAHDEPLRSGIGTVEVLSVLEITKQPESAYVYNTILSTDPTLKQTQKQAKFNVGAKVSGKNEGEDITYQWYFDSGTDSYGIKYLFRHYNPESYDHYCSDNPVPASGYQSEGVLCQVFIHQAPGTIAIIDAEPDTPTVDRPDTGIVGYAYPTMIAAIRARLGSSTNSPLIAVYDMVRNDRRTHGFEEHEHWTIDEMWSTSPTEGVTPTSGIITIVGDNDTSYTLDTSLVQSYDLFVPGVTYTLTSNVNLTVRCYAKGAGGGYSRISRADGGDGGLASGVFTFLTDQEYILRVGGKGTPGIIGESSGTNYAAGTTYTSLTHLSGTSADIFESSVGTRALWGTPTNLNAYSFIVTFTNIPAASKSLRVYIWKSTNTICLVSTDNRSQQFLGALNGWTSIDFNMISSINSNFDDGIGGWFARDEVGPGNLATVEWDSTGSWDGTGALKLVQNNSDTPMAVLQEFGAQADETYNLSFKYKSGSGSFSVTPMIIEDDNITQVAIGGALTARTLWRTASFKFKPSNDFNYIALRINSGAGTKELYIDNVVLEIEGESFTLASIQFSGGQGSSGGSANDNVAIFGIEVDGEVLNDATGYVAEYNEGGYNGGGNGKGYLGQAGSGGGFTGFFDGLLEKSRSILIAAGGGGAANDGAGASAGGGLAGETLSAAWNRRGGPGTQNNGGEGGGNSQAASAANGPGLLVGEYGSELQGGNGAGGGGGGYWGGGGGVTNRVAGADGDGGGGSSYVHPTLISEGENIMGGGGKGTYENNEDGSFLIEVTNYAGGTTYSGTYYSGTPANIFDGQLDTSLFGRPNSFTIFFTNLPIPTTSLRVYIVQESGTCSLWTGSPYGSGGSSGVTHIVKEGKWGIHPGNGAWVTVGDMTGNDQPIQTISWTGGSAGDGCGLYAIEIDGEVLGDESGYINKGIKFYAPTTEFTTPTDSLLLNDGDLVKKSTTWEFTGAPDEYAPYIVSALPLNSKTQFVNQDTLISGGAQNPTKTITGNTVSSGYGSPTPFTIVTSETMSELEDGVGAKFYGSCARKPLGADSSAHNTSFLRITLGEGAAFRTGAYTMEWWQFVDKQDFGDPQTWGVDFNYPPARDSYSAAGITPFIRIENTSDWAQNSRIRYYKWNAQHRRTADTFGYGGYLTYSQWQHIAITRDDNSIIRIFIDGKLTNSLYSDTTDYTGTQFYCITGIHPFTEGYYVQDHRIYSGVAKYTENFTPPSQMMIYAIKERKTFTDDGDFLLPSNAINIKLEVAGAKGGDGGSDLDGARGSGGKGRQGTFILDSSAAAGEEFVVKVGNAGNDGPSCSGEGGSGGDGGGGNGGDAIGCSGFGGGGGGATSVGLVKWGDGFIVAGGGGGGGGGAWERSGDNGADCSAFSASNSANIAIDPGSAGSDADNNGSGGGGGGAGVSGGAGGRGGVDKSYGGGGGHGGTSQYYSVSTTYYRVIMYRDYTGPSLYDHICTTDPAPGAGYSRDGILCRIYKNQAPHTVAIRDNDEPSRYDGPIMGYAFPDLQAVHAAGLNAGNVRPIYRLEGKNRWGFYDIMWSIHDDEGSPTYTNTGVKFYAPWAPLTVTGQVGGDTFSVLESETLNDGDGFVDLSYEHTSEYEPVIAESSDILNIAGSKTPELTLKSNYASDENVYCQVSSVLATNSPLDTNKVTYVNKVVEGLITIDFIGGGIIQSSNINLSNGDYMIGNWSSDTNKHQVVNYVSFYSSLDDVEIEMDMYGGIGEDGVDSLGGQGGFSRIQFKIERNVEYVIAGLTDDVRAPFLYRKSNLMAVVGGGGQGGYDGNVGGSGGGVGVRGGDGTKGNDYGSGGDYIDDGSLGVDGTFGSSFYVDPSTLQPGDVSNNANELYDTWQNAVGRTIKCSKGPYWISRGYGPCQDMGGVRFVDENGVEPPVNNTNSITRGFKSGYSIMQTGALGRVSTGIKVWFARYKSYSNFGYRGSISLSGNGGNGAAGGKGATQNGGGGGGSGYQDGSVTVIHTQQGGSTGRAKVVMRLKKNTLGSSGSVGVINSNDPLAGLYTDDQGRILILSSTDYSDPRYLPKRTGNPVEPGSNGVIDDTKWQYILDLARDGTKDYRLAVCAPNGNYGARTKIAGANPRNIHRMMNGNQLTLRNSLTGWLPPNSIYPENIGYANRLILAWDETSGRTIGGSDYSMLWWVSGAGWGYYGNSSNSFFSPTIYYQKSAEWWLLPPGVPDF